MASVTYLPDPEAVASALDASAPGARTGPLTVSFISGGKSNLTYLIADGTHEWVLRRPPLGHVLATAHDMTREYTVIRALGATSVPVPDVVLLCQDESVLGCTWYLMDKVAGVAYSSAAALQPQGTTFARTAGEHLVDVLAALHSIDPASVGLADFGRPLGYLERNIERWNQQLAKSRSREIDGIDQLYASLRSSLPPRQPGTIIHGDYRLGNVLLDDQAAITAVLDWEMSTLGDPLTDLGLLVMYSQVDSLVDGIGDPTVTGFPSASELVERYAQLSGRDVSQLNWYEAFSYFKLAVIIEGIYYRHAQGQTVGSGFDQLGGFVAPLVAAGTHALKGR